MLFCFGRNMYRSHCILILIFILNDKLTAYKFNFDAADIEFSTVLKAKSRECFYQFAKPPQTLRFEFRVVDAGYSKFDVNSDLKITFYVISPQKKTVLQENKKDMAILKYKVTSPGDYKVCLDNGFSQSYEKTVYFEISIDTETNWDTINEMLEEDTKSNDTISRLKRTAQKVRTNFENIKHYQDTLRAVEARDINIQEKNLTKVNSYSSLTTVAMILFGALHLLLLKSLFNPSSLLFKILKILC